VKVTIRRHGVDHPLEFEIVRDEIPIESVPYVFMIAPGTGYIRMRNFSARTSEELLTSLEKLDSQGMQRLILDLRGNSGGYLNAAVDVCDLFLDGPKKIVYTVGRIPGSSEEYFGSDHSRDFDLPLIVLIDTGSASASEIVAGAMQDWDRGLVVGQTSFGKGLVQRQYRLHNGGALLLTVARYYTPSGRLIQRPYLPDKRDEYFQELADREKAPAAVDSAAPLFHTLVRSRLVTGGGGITPDIVLDRSYRSSVLNADLMYERKYLDFTDQYVPEHRDRFPEEFTRFLADTTLPRETLRDFRAMLDADSFKYSPDSLATYENEISRSLRSEFARYLWGENERWQVLVSADPMVREALALLPQAETMLAETRRIEAEQAAAH
jgi:carboxyl-terminal processing protease